MLLKKFVNFIWEINPLTKVPSFKLLMYVLIKSINKINKKIAFKNKKKTKSTIKVDERFSLNATILKIFEVPCFFESF